MTRIIITPRKSNGPAKRTWRKTKIAGLIFGAVIVAGAMYGDHWTTEQLSYVVAQPVYAGITMDAKVDVLKEDILNRLLACESAGHSEEDGIIIFDANDRASIGQLQFQKATVIHYMDKLYGKKISGKEAVAIALDTERARLLAHDIIWDTKGGIWNWTNCANKLDLVAEITVIKKLLTN